MNNENKQQFISDFYLSAFLLSKGLKLVGLKKTSDPRRTLFVFKEHKDRQRLTEDFMFGNAQIEPKSFISSIKELKQLLHSEL